MSRRYRLPVLISVFALVAVGAGCGSSSSNPKDGSADAREVGRDSASEGIISPADVSLEAASADFGSDAVDAPSDVGDVAPDAPADAAIDLIRPEVGDARDAREAGPSDAVDAPPADVRPLDAVIDLTPALDGPVTLAQVSALLAGRCVTCHGGTGATAALLDLSDNPDAGTALYDRLLGPIRFEPFCGELDAGAGEDAAPHLAIVPDQLGSSYLYLKITGEQPNPGAPPQRCGARMPRAILAVLDGGAINSTGCDQADGGAAANCLTAGEIAIVRNWILQGAPR